MHPDKVFIVEETQIIVKMEVKSRFGIFGIIFPALIVIMLASAVSAFSLGVSPATLDFKAAPGYTVEKTLTISSSSEEALKVSVSAESEIKEWMSFDSDSLEVKKDSPLKLKVKIKVPGDAAEKTYEDAITVSAAASAQAEEGAGSAIATGVAVKTSLEVSSKFKSEGKRSISWGLIASIAIAVIIIAALITLWMRKRRKWARPF